MYKSAFLTDLDESLGGIRSVRMHHQSAGFWKSLNFQVNQQQQAGLFHNLFVRIGKNESAWLAAVFISLIFINLFRTVYLCNYSLALL